MKKSKVLELHNQVVKSVSNYRKAEADLIEKLALAERERVYADMGYADMFVYIRDGLGFTSAVTYNLIAVLRKTYEVPELKTLIKKGKVGISKASKVCSVLNKSNKDKWLPMLTSVSTRQLEAEVADKEDRKPKESIRRLTSDYSRLNLDIDDEMRDLLERAVELYSTKKRCPKNRIETIKESLRVYVDKNAPEEKSKRAKTKEQKKKEKAAEYLHVRENTENENEDISKKSVPAKNEKGARTAIPADIQHEYIAINGCECQHIGADGHKCGSKKWLEWHHIKPVSEGGEHSVDNLMLVCSCHHKLLHKKMKPEQ